MNVRNSFVKSILVALILSSQVCFPQFKLFNNSGKLHVKQGGLLHVNGTVENNGSAALIDNEGTITSANSNTAGHFVINNSSTVQGDGLYEVDGDWNNNATFTHNSSEVVLQGGDQLITGTIETVFHDLTLRATGIKRQTLNSHISTAGTLNLTDRELATDAHAMYVANPDPNAIIRTSGFVSSLADGHLSRVTNQKEVYLYPTGSSLGVTRYRPVEMTPASAFDNTYTVRLANNDATIDGYDRSQSAFKLPGISNELYYHRINRTMGADAARIAVYYDATADREFNSLAQWNTPVAAHWNSMEFSKREEGSPMKSIVAPMWYDFSNDPYVLTYLEGLFIPNVFTPNDDGDNDQFYVSNAGIEKFQLKIFNRWGTLLFETTSPEIRWDGTTLSGTPCNTGTYYYEIKALADSDTEYLHTGFLTLLRD